MRAPSAALAVIAATAAVLVCAPAADAGVYTVHSCRTPDGAAAAADDWKVITNYPALNASGSTCPTGNFWLEMQGATVQPKDAYLRATFRAPAGTTIRSYTLWRSVQVGNLYHWRYSEMPGGSWDDRIELDHCYGENGCRSLGSQTSPLNPANVVGRTAAPNVTALDLHLTCGHSNTGSLDCEPVNPAVRAQLHRADIQLEDKTPPVFTTTPSGPLVTAGASLTGVQTVTVDATDNGGGVYLGQVEVDGQVVSESVIDPNGGSCQEPFRRAQPCKRTARGTLEFDTTKLPDGAHTVRVLVTDATRENVAASTPVQIVTDNNACNPSPLAQTPTLSATPRRLRVSYRRSPVVRGRLVGADGTPLAGAAVCVLERLDTAVSDTTRAAMLTTNADGRFSLRLPPGPARRLTFVHRTGGASVVATARVGVAAPVSLRASDKDLLNGDKVVLSGRLKGRPLPAGGALVELQAARGKRWVAFGTTRSRAGGRFRFAYRFTRTQGTQIYKLRAVVPRQPYYPFTRGASGAVRVRVVG